jgi:hypothetical protein
VARKVDAPAQRRHAGRLRGDARALHERASACGSRSASTSALPPASRASVRAWRIRARAAAARARRRRRAPAARTRAATSRRRRNPPSPPRSRRAAAARGSSARARRDRRVVREGERARAQVVERAALRRQVMSPSRAARSPSCSSRCAVRACARRRGSWAGRCAPARRRGDRFGTRGLVEAAGAHRQATQLEQRVDARHARRCARARPGRDRSTASTAPARPGPGCGRGRPAARERIVGLAQRGVDLCGSITRHVRPPLRRDRPRAGARRRWRGAARDGFGLAAARRARLSPAGGQQGTGRRRCRAAGSRGRAIRFMGRRPRPQAIRT